MKADPFYSYFMCAWYYIKKIATFIQIIIKNIFQNLTKARKKKQRYKSDRVFFFFKNKSV